jgi:serine/threonine-protein kinase RIO1
MEMIVEDRDDQARDNNSFVNSPQLKEVDFLPLEKWENCYEQTLHIVQDLYQKCKLVHADLSEYNLLLHNKEHVFALVRYGFESVSIAT